MKAFEEIKGSVFKKIEKFFLVNAIVIPFAERKVVNHSLIDIKYSGSECSFFVILHHHCMHDYLDEVGVLQHPFRETNAWL